MIKIYDVVSDSGKEFRFIFTPAGTENIFRSVRDIDMVTLINKSIPCKHLKDHGTLLFGDPAEEFLSNHALIEKVYKETGLSTKAMLHVQHWIKYHHHGNTEEVVEIISFEVKENTHGRKVWYITECNYDPEIIGDITMCGVPRTDDLPIGTKRIVVTTTIIPLQKSSSNI